MGVTLPRVKKITVDPLNGLEIVGSASAGVKIGTAATEKFAFFGATPVTKPAAAAQAAAGTTTGTAAGTTTGSAVTTADITTSAVTTGAAGAYCFATSTQANNLATVAANTRTLANVLQSRVDELIALANTNRTRVGEVITLVNRLRTDMVTLGLIKGSA